MGIAAPVRRPLYKQQQPTLSSVKAAFSPILFTIRLVLPFVDCGPYILGHHEYGDCDLGRVRWVDQSKFNPSAAHDFSFSEQETTRGTLEPGK